ncbi:VOC family protein [Psychromonas sp. KJ10-10]|uniref:VOC family protein n=1 Tax=Psychromonas sp. KJ10-10 TaxID=3391823 RepID=UPI0039B667DB
MKIDYLEIPSKNMEITKEFFSTVFEWTFEGYGAEYMVFWGAGINGGFYFHPDLTCTTATGSVLPVLYSEDISATQSKIVKAGGEIIKPLFAFPGGIRFHFTDPNGNEYAVWSDAKLPKGIV